MEERGGDLGLRGFFFFRFGSLSARPQLRLLALGAPCLAARARNDIHNNAAVVLAAIRACAMRNAQSTALALSESLTRNRPM